LLVIHDVYILLDRCVHFATSSGECRTTAIGPSLTSLAANNGADHSGADILWW